MTIRALMRRSSARCPRGQSQPPECRGPAPSGTVPPGRASAAGCGADPGIMQDLPHHGRSDRVAELDEFALHAPVPSCRVVRRHADHEFPDRGCLATQEDPPGAGDSPNRSSQSRPPGATPPRQSAWPTHEATLSGCSVTPGRAIADTAKPAPRLASGTPIQGAGENRTALDHRVRDQPQGRSRALCDTRHRTAL